MAKEAAGIRNVRDGAIDAKTKGGAKVISEDEEEEEPYVRQCLGFDGRRSR